MGKSLFSRGYSQAREEAERQERARANAGKLIYEFFLKSDKKNRSTEADVIFLTDEPVNFHMHTLPRGNRFDSFVCCGNDCPDCDRGDTPSYKGAYLIYDRRPYEYTNIKGETIKKKGQIRLYFAGIRVMSQLDTLNLKTGLLHRECTILRTGTGMQTSYNFMLGNKLSVTKKVVNNWLADLHEDIRDLYDGTDDSLYAIIEEQLKMRMRNAEEDEDDELPFKDDDDYDDTLVGDEDEEDDDFEEEDEDEDDIPPVSSKGLFRKTAKTKKSSTMSKPSNKKVTKTPLKRSSTTTVKKKRRV